MLTSEEKSLIKLIASDLETGRHLLRNKKDWKKIFRVIRCETEKMPTREKYEELMKELTLAVEHFSWYSNEDETTEREKEMLIIFKSAQDYEFYEKLRLLF